MALSTMSLKPPRTHTLCHGTLEILPLKEQSLFPVSTHFDLGFGHWT